MSFFGRLILALIGFAIGYVMLTGTVPFVRTFGKMPLAEQYLGQGQTYLVWKLLGMGLMFVSVLFLIGKIPWPF